MGLERSRLYFMIIPLFRKSVNFACMRITKRKFYVIVILLNLIMISHVIIMRGKYGCRNFHVTKLPLIMLRLLMFLSSSLHMLDLSCLDNLFSYKITMHREYVRLRCDFHMLHGALFVFQLLSFM